MAKYTFHQAQDRIESETGTSLSSGLIVAGKVLSLVSTAVGEVVTLQEFLGKPHAEAALLLLSVFFAIVLFVALSPAKRKIVAFPVALGLAALVAVSVFHTTREPGSNPNSNGGPAVRTSSTSGGVALNGTGAKSSSSPSLSTTPTTCCQPAPPGPVISETTVIGPGPVFTGTGPGPGPRPTTSGGLPNPPNPPSPTSPQSTRTTPPPASPTTTSTPTRTCGCQPPPTGPTGPTGTAIQEPAKNHAGILTLPNDGSSADLDSTAADWGIHKGDWTGSGIAYGEDATGDFLGLAGSPDNTALMGSGGGWTYASCRTGATYGADAQGAAIDPGHGLCVFTRAGRQALIVVKSRTDQAITLDVTVWD